MASKNSHRSNISQETVQKATKALLKWKKSNSKGIQESEIFEKDEDDCVYLVLTLKKIPQQGLSTPHKIPLPHPVRSFQEDPLLSYDFCLIIDDRPKSQPNLKVTVEAALKKIKSEGLPITKVLKFSKLKSNYQSFEAKTKLCDSYDIFLADKRVVPQLPKMLGKPFFKKKKKVPVPVDLIHRNWKEQIETAFSSSLLCLSTGTCSLVKVGSVSMGCGNIVENVMAAIDGIAEIVPCKWGGVRALHLKLSDSLALPIYQALPKLGLNVEEIKGEGEKLEVKNRRKKNEGTDQLKGLKTGMIRGVN